MKKGFILAIAVLATLMIAGCATPFKPSPYTTAMARNMSEQEATDLIHGLLRPRNLNGIPARTFITGYIGLGLCKAGQLSLDENKGVDLRVTTQEISFNAVRTGGLVKSTQQGRISSLSGMTSISQYEHIPYREQLRFDKIEEVTVHEPSVLRTLCNRQNGQSEVVIRESMTHWYVALIPTGEKERFMAALLRLRPDITLTDELPKN